MKLYDKLFSSMDVNPGKLKISRRFVHDQLSLFETIHEWL